jgi:hypothetical protein
MDLPIEILESHQIDYENFAGFQKVAFAKRLEELNYSDSYLNADFFRWKYNPPAGHAKIAILRKGTELISTTSLVPIDIIFEGEKVRGWQLCDAATHPKAMGRGYHRKTEKELINALGMREIVFVFPNHSTIQSLIDNNFILKETIRTWFKPVSCNFHHSNNNVTQIDFSQSNIDKIFSHSHGKNETGIYRSAEYMNWRYSRHPINTYASFVYSHGDRTNGFATIRSVRALGREMVALMEFWGDDRGVRSALLQNIKEWMYKNQNSRLIFQDNRMSAMDGIGFGFLPVPSIILPKKQVLMLYAKPEEFKMRILKSAWHIQWGDWDGF